MRWCILWYGLGISSPIDHDLQEYCHNFSECSEVKASIPGPSNKLVSEWELSLRVYNDIDIDIHWVIEYVIFLRGLAQEWRSLQKRNLAQG